MRRRESHYTMPRARDAHARASWISFCQVCAAALLWLGLVSLLASCKAQPTPLPSPVAERPTPCETPRAPAGFGCLAFQVEPDTIWLVRGGGLPQPLTEGREPLLSPDGRFLAFLRSFPNEVWVRALDGSGEEMLYVGKPVVYSMAWSPDGQMLAITNGAHAKVLPTGDLWRVDVPAGTATELAAEKAGYPVFSPDGRWIALSVPQGWTRGSIAIIGSGGQDYRLLFDGVLLRALEWSRDSSGFAVALTRIGSSSSRESELWWAPIDREPMPLGRLTEVGSLAWRPGTEGLLYTSLREGEQGPLHLADRDGTAGAVVPGSEGMILRGGLHGRGLSPWSPDGHWFLTAGGEGNFYLLDAHTPGPPQLLEAEMVYGWLDGAHYLAGYREEPYVHLCLFEPPGTCELLARVPASPAALTYVRTCAQ